jgi:antitoxin CcdA
MAPPAPQKQRTNISVEAGTLAAAREYGLNVSAISEAALVREVSLARARAWADDNAGALAERRDWIARNGTLLADVQILKQD